MSRKERIRKEKERELQQAAQREQLSWIKASTSINA